MGIIILSKTPLTAIVTIYFIHFGFFEIHSFDFRPINKFSKACFILK